MMFKENWTNLPATFRQAKRFFLGNKDQSAHKEPEIAAKIAG